MNLKGGGTQSRVLRFNKKERESKVESSENEGRGTLGTEKRSEWDICWQK